LGHWAHLEETYISAGISCLPRRFNSCEPTTDYIYFSHYYLLSAAALLAGNQM
jgi:hypothetical protein